MSPSSPPRSSPYSSSPTPWSRAEDVLRQRYVTDVLVPGRIDRDGAVPRFAPQPLVVFVVLDEGALRLESVDGYGRLEVRVVDSVALDGVELFADIEEEGDELALASQGEQLFGDSWDRLRCSTIRPFMDSGSKPGEGVVRCLALELESRYWLFFDPTWSFGIRIGNAEDMRRWEREYGDRPE
ncbi:MULTISPECIES: hypothetical protein [unclassified Streptomyces]|uniref:hypothetical protein n=1 Tax=unclassified Streptomyces TaxID=2593676 RepID=UPI002256C81D|nr:MULTISPECIES: hypothetical protein [unclassified Streptomyces]MCX4883310.1 hypothetical protein [Streptomyces sp. NBC_00847]MCX5423332.1 hypothetical protein [Streptomyces sp. NBC_00078]